MAYVLNNFNKTYYDRANRNSQAMLDKWPYLCSREALVKALEGSSITSGGGASHRNPNGYSADEMADKIIELFDEIMYDTWFDSTVYHPLSLQGSINGGNRWDQAAFWDNFNTHFIFHAGGGAGVDHYVLDNVANENILIWPAKAYGVNSAEFKRKPFLGFDKEMMKSQFAAELDLINPGVDGRVDGLNGGYGLTNALVDAGSFVVGVEYNIREVGDTDFTLIGASQNVVNTVFTATGAGTGTGKARETAGIITSDGDNPIPAADIHPSLLFVYANNFFHPTLQPNGFDNSYWDGSLPADWNDFPSSKRYDLNRAKFEVTVSGGVVTAITGVATLDGDGNSVTGGWDYYDSDSYKELSFQGGIASSSGTQSAPRILFRTHIDQSGYSGNKATVNITDPTTEFYAGKNLTDGTYDAYATTGGVGTGYQITPSVSNSYTNWYDINLPKDVLPSSVRMVIERPVLKSTTRSLKEIIVGTGAHRIGWEFEYPPMTESEADAFIDFFEIAKGGAREVQILVPHTAMPHTEYLFYNVDVDVAANYLQIIGGKTVGSDQLTISGLQPGYNAGYYMKGIYFNHDLKTYRIKSAQTVDDYGRTTITFEPPLVSAGSNSIRARTTNQDRAYFYHTKARLVDDTLDYTVDAAGHYRLRFKFVEAL